MLSKYIVFQLSRPPSARQQIVLNVSLLLCLKKRLKVIALSLENMYFPRHTDGREDIFLLNLFKSPNCIKILVSVPPVSDCSITDEELVTFNVKELNRILKTKGEYQLVLPR